jgi:hypothetical protein
VVFDLDHFKAINDTHGHAAGDAVLRAVASVVAGELRCEDSFGRLGGEEFAILVGNADASGAARVWLRGSAARLRPPLFAGNPGLRVTASFGVAELSRLFCQHRSMARCMPMRRSIWPRAADATVCVSMKSLRAPSPADAPLPLTLRMLANAAAAMLGASGMTHTAINMPRCIPG